jgi:hypothetical protein
MEGASVAAVVSAFGVGGVTGIWIRAEHERTERFRERMIVTAEEFIRAATNARAALAELDRGGSDGTSLLAKDAITKVHDIIPSISIIFPSRSGRRDLDQAAGPIWMTLQSILIAMTLADAQSEEGRKRLADRKVLL